MNCMYTLHLPIGIHSELECRCSLDLNKALVLGSTWCRKCTVYFWSLNWIFGPLILFNSHVFLLPVELSDASFLRFGPVNLFWSTRYDKAMTLFLTCLKEFAQFANSKDKENNIPPEKCFKLPFK